MKKLSVLEVTRSDLKIEPVTCGTCPVNIACAMETYGGGANFTCCGAVGVDMGDFVYAVDCQNHHFKIPSAANPDICTLCTGLAIVLDQKQIGKPEYWVPTVHAKISVEGRLRVWRKFYEKQAEQYEAKERKRGR